MHNNNRSSQLNTFFKLDPAPKQLYFMLLLLRPLQSASPRSRGRHPRLDHRIADDGALVLQLVVLKRKLNDACKHPCALLAPRLHELSNVEGTTGLHTWQLQVVLVNLLDERLRRDF